MRAVLEFVAANPTLCLVLLFLVTVSFAKLPPPDKARHPYQFAVWRILATLSFASWDRWGGLLKLPGSIVPRPTWLDSMPPPRPPTDSRL